MDSEAAAKPVAAPPVLTPEQTSRNKSVLACLAAHGIKSLPKPGTPEAARAAGILKSHGF